MITNKNFACLSLSVIKIHGPDAQKYLQGQLTIDLNTLPENTAQLTAHCNAQGRMVSLGYLLKKQEIYFYLIPQDILETSLKHLKKFVLRSKVNFELLDSNTFKIFGLWGDLSQLLIWKDLFFKIDTHRILIFCEALKHATQIQEDLLAAHFNFLPENHWLKNQIENKTAWLDKNTQEKFLPDEIKLADQDGVCLTKGCFIGQEIIARMHYLAHSKNFLKTELIESAEPGDALSGKIICQVHLDHQTYCLTCNKN